MPQFIAAWSNQRLELLRHALLNLRLHGPGNHQRDPAAELQEGRQGIAAAKEEAKPAEDVNSQRLYLHHSLQIGVLDAVALRSTGRPMLMTLYARKCARKYDVGLSHTNLLIALMQKSCIAKALVKARLYML